MEFVEIYTDGGTRGNGNENAIGGYGVYLKYIVNGGLVKELELKGGAIGVTNNIMELQGAIEGLKAMKNKNIEIHMYLDSRYVIDGFSKGWIVNWKRNGWKTANKKDVKNKELWQELDLEYNKFTNLTLHWVKGHNDNEGNERADALANEYMDYLEENL